MAGDVDVAKVVAEAEKLSEKIKPMLYGKGHMVQGVVLADLVSVWLAGHRPDVRTDVLAQLTVMAAEFVPLAEMKIFGPKGWRDIENDDGKVH